MLNNILLNNNSINDELLNAIKDNDINKIKDIFAIIEGMDNITISDAVASKLKYLKLYGSCYQEQEPTLNSPVQIKCNDGYIRFKDTELKDGFVRLTGMHMNADCYFEIPGFNLKGSDTLRVSFSAEKACNLLGCYSTTDATDNYSIYVSTSSGSKYARYNGGAYNSAITPNTRYDIVMSPNGCVGFNTASTWDEQSFVSHTDFLIGTTSKTATSSSFIGDLYGNVEIDNRAKFIPCIRTSDNVVGYYETYNEIFYTPTKGAASALEVDNSYKTFYIDGDKEHLILKDGNNNINYDIEIDYLLGLQDKYDEYNLINGRINKRVFYKVLNGTEKIYSSTKYENTLYISKFVNDVSANREITPLCTHFKTIDSFATTQPLNTCFFTASNDNLYFKVSFSATEFKAYLTEQYNKQTPLILIYASSEDTIEQHTKHVIELNEGVNTIIRNGEISNLKLSAKYLKNKE